jgi:hypothetical protein
MSPVSKIQISRENEKFSILLIDCDLIFRGSRVSFSNLPTIDDEINLKSCSAMNVFEGNYLNINDFNLVLANANIANVIFKSCKLKIENKDVHFEGDTITFNKCSVENETINLSFTQLGGRNNGSVDLIFKSEQLKTGLFKIDKEKVITISGIEIYFTQGTSVRVLELDQAQFIYSPNNKIDIFNGKVDSIETNQIIFNIVVAKNCFVRSISASNRFSFENISANMECEIKINHDGLNLKSFCKVSRIIIGPVRLDEFICDDCDFSKTQIHFQNGASISFDGFHSIATVWNPNLIMYRGFQPSIKIDKTANIPAAREFFCEMKTKFNDKGDSITAGEFHCAEMNAHQAYLNNQDFWLAERKTILLQDRISMFVSRWSSDFGQNWILSLAIYILTGSLFSIIFLLQGVRLYCYDYARFLADMFSPLSIDFWELRGMMQIPSWNIFLWMVWKIIAGFLIYQIVISSRRFIRKW